MNRKHLESLIVGIVTPIAVILFTLALAILFRL